MIYRKQKLPLLTQTSRTSAEKNVAVAVTCDQPTQAETHSGNEQALQQGQTFAVTDDT